MVTPASGRVRGRAPRTLAGGRRGPPEGRGRDGRRHGTDGGGGASGRRGRHRRAARAHRGGAPGTRPAGPVGGERPGRRGGAQDGGGAGRRDGRLGPPARRHGGTGRRRGAARDRPPPPGPAGVPGHGGRGAARAAAVGLAVRGGLRVAAGGHPGLPRGAGRHRRAGLPGSPAPAVLQGAAALPGRARVLLAHPGALRRRRLPEVTGGPGLPRLLRGTTAAQRPVDLGGGTRFAVRAHRADRRGGAQRRAGLRLRAQLFRPARRLHLQPPGRPLQRDPRRDRPGGPQLPQVGPARSRRLGRPSGLPRPHPQRLRPRRTAAARRHRGRGGRGADRRRRPHGGRGVPARPVRGVHQLHVRRPVLRRGGGRPGVRAQHAPAPLRRGVVRLRPLPSALRRPLRHVGRRGDLPRARPADGVRDPVHAQTACGAVAGRHGARPVRAAGAGGTRAVQRGADDARHDLPAVR
ncbi:hypothetical protein B0E37_01355 [Streptomyces sp. MH192]|nr:hypothetical protein [Streptomyces sp. MH192]MCF0100049.1 hypothetical protein [Streptomyces sp. MH191]